MPIAVIVHWFGPYKGLKALRAEVKAEWKGRWRTLYMALSRGNKPQYVGLTERPCDRIFDETHFKLKHRDNKMFYIGYIATQGSTGPRNGGHPPDLKLAEHALISFLQPRLNTNKKKKPKDCVSIFSCFYDEDYKTPTNPLQKFPTILAYNSFSDEWFSETKPKPHPRKRTWLNAKRHQAP